MFKKLIDSISRTAFKLKVPHDVRPAKSMSKRELIDILNKQVVELSKQAEMFLDSPPVEKQFVAVWEYNDELWSETMFIREDGTLMIFSNSEDDFIEEEGNTTHPIFINDIQGKMFMVVPKK